jgi:hypothetical protein
MGILGRIEGNIVYMELGITMGLLFDWHSVNRSPMAGRLDRQWLCSEATTCDWNHFYAVSLAGRQSITSSEQYRKKKSIMNRFIFVLFRNPKVSSRETFSLSSINAVVHFTMIYQGLERLATVRNVPVATTNINCYLTIGLI